MTPDAGNFLQGVLLAVGALLPIVNPFGNAAMFVALTSDLDDAARKVMARRVAINGFILLVASIFVGDYVLAFFGVSIPVVQVAGGLVVASLGWRMLRADEKDARPAPAGNPETRTARAFYPLTLPMTVGPGSISVAITIGANFPSTVQPFLADAGSTVLGALLVCLTTFVCFRNAERVTARLGPAGTAVFMRLSAFILLCIGVQILANGIDALFPGLKLPR
ncbi:MAG: MarC family protein [Burkholderiales bacterium]